jgi:4-hydroxy-tetrahydrodipicolinate synthase
MENTPPETVISGIYAALATPRRKSLVEPDTAAFLDYLDAVVRAGVDGIVLFGSTGEFVHFDIADRIQTLNLAIRRSRVPVLVNVSHSTLDGAIALAEDAIDRGAAGVLLMPPYFFQYNEEELEQFYLQFADNLSGNTDRRTPIYLYNIPLFTSPLSVALAGRLLMTGRFAGIKDSGGEWSYFQALNKLRATSNFQFMVGGEAIYLQARLEGASGAVSGLAGAVPELLVAIERAVRQGKQDRASHLNQRLLEFVDRISKLPPTVGIKQAAVVRGWPLDHFAVPLGATYEAELKAYWQWLEHWIPETLADSKS